MADPFSTVPVRTRTDGKILVGWFNALRTAGSTLATSLGGGSGSIAETTFTFANATGPSDITGLLFDHTVNRTFEAKIMVHRKTNSNEALSWVTLVGIYRDGTGWDLAAPREDGDSSGITFSITAGGQVQYTSDSMSGTGYTGDSRFRAAVVAGT